MKAWLQDNDIEIYSTIKEGKSVVTERYIRNLKNKIYEDRTAVSKNVQKDKLDDKVNKYNNTYHRKIKMKPLDIKASTYIDFDVENNDKNRKFKVGDHQRMSKYKRFFAKAQKNFFWLKKLKMLYRGYMFSMILMVRKLLERFTKKNSKRKIKQKLELKR